MRTGDSPVIALRGDHTGGVTTWLDGRLTGVQVMEWAVQVPEQLTFLQTFKATLTSRGLFEVVFSPEESGAYVRLSSDRLAHVNSSLQPQCLAIVGGESRVIRGTDRVHVATTTHLELSYGSLDHVPQHCDLVVDGKVTVTENTVIFAMPNPSRSEEEVDAFARRVADELRLYISSNKIRLAKPDLEAEHIRAFDFRQPVEVSASAADTAP